MHEWKYEGGFPPQSSIDENGEIIETKEPVENLITWVFEDGNFVPCAKLLGEEQYSIVADFLGTPKHAYNSSGNEVWHREIDCYGKTRKLNGDKDFCPYLYQGQSIDEETGLAYNRFRYYDNESGSYLSQDPIGLFGGWTPYSYVSDTNGWVDFIGLVGQRWADKVKKDGTPYKKPGPQSKGTGDHNSKIDEIVKRESAKPDVEHICGGSKTEISIDTPAGTKPIRRMDASFRGPDGDYHINVGRTLKDGKTGIIRERLAVDDVKAEGHKITFEGYGKASAYSNKTKGSSHH